MKIPCEDCICLAICRQENKNLDTKYFWIAKETILKCSLVMEYRHITSKYNPITKYLTLESGKENENTM